MRGDGEVDAVAGMDAEFVRRAIRDADLNALRVALYQATGDETFARMRLRRVSARGGASEQVVVAPEDVSALTEAACDYLLSGPHDVPPPPDDDGLRTLMETLTGEKLGAEDFAYRRDIVAFDEFPRAASWTAGRPRLPDGFAVAIVGAGFNGIAVATQLERLGIPYTIFERRSDIGGTWDINSYPDVRVDTTNFIYQFSFEKNYPWPEYFSRAEDVKRYLRHVATRRGVLPHIEFGSDVVRGDFDAATGRWTLTVSGDDGERVVRANVVVAASGLFSTPNVPDVLTGFVGPVVHTARWTGAEEIDGRRVAIIGNGSTGVQLLASVARRAARVHVFQRTPQWIAGRERYGESISPQTRWLLDTMPFYANWYVYSMLETALGTQRIQEFDPEWQARGGLVSEKNDLFRANLVDYISSKVGGRPDLVERLTPHYAPMARRLIVDNHWYETLLEDHVELVTDPIAEVRANEIVTEDGVVRPVDQIIAATGFEVTKYVHPAVYRGRNGRTLEQIWADIGGGPRAYLGLTVPEMPNFFLMYGPNAQPRSGSIVSWFEIWARYVAQSVVLLVEGGHRSMTVRRDVFDDYNVRLDEESKRIVWTEPGAKERNYYVNDVGRQQVGNPWRVVEYFSCLARVNSDDYEFE